MKNWLSRNEDIMTLNNITLFHPDRILITQDIVATVLKNIILRKTRSSALSFVPEPLYLLDENCYNLQFF